MGPRVVTDVTGAAAKVGSQGEMYPGVLGTIFTKVCKLKPVFK